MDGWQTRRCVPVSEETAAGLARLEEIRAQRQQLERDEQCLAARDVEVCELRGRWLLSAPDRLALLLGEDISRREPPPPLTARPPPRPAEPPRQAPAPLPVREGRAPGSLLGSGARSLCHGADTDVHGELLRRVQERRAVAADRAVQLLLQATERTRADAACSSPQSEFIAPPQPPPSLWVVAPPSAPRGVDGLYTRSAVSQGPPEWVSPRGRLWSCGEGAAARWALGPRGGGRGDGHDILVVSAAPHSGRWPHESRLWVPAGAVGLGGCGTADWASALRVLPAPADAPGHAVARHALEHPEHPEHFPGAPGTGALAAPRASVGWLHPGTPPRQSPHGSPCSASPRAAASGVSGSGGGGREEEYEEEEEDDDEAGSAGWHDGGAAEDAPQSLWVTAPGQPQVSGGPYELAVGLKNRQAVWECGDCRLFSSSDGYWVVSDSSEFVYMGRAGGFISSLEPHRGVPPHRCECWESKSPATGRWEPDPSVGVLEYGGVPPQLWVTCTSAQPPPHIALVVGGPYELRREMCNSCPTWRMGDRMLYSGRNGLWIATESAAHVPFDGGCVASAARHGGAMPHEVAAWAAAQSERSWVPAPTVRVTAAPPSTRAAAPSTPAGSQALGQLSPAGGRAPRVQSAGSQARAAPAPVEVEPIDREELSPQRVNQHGQPAAPSCASSDVEGVAAFVAALGTSGPRRPSTR